MSRSAMARMPVRGMNVARLEARIAIGRLLARFPGIEPAGTPKRDRRMRFRGFRRLPVRLRARGR